MFLYMQDSFWFQITHNRIFLITLFVWFLAQSTKVLLGFFKEKRFNFRWFIGTEVQTDLYNRGLESPLVSDSTPQGILHLDRVGVATGGKRRLSAHLGG